MSMSYSRASRLASLNHKEFDFQFFVYQQEVEYKTWLGAKRVSRWIHRIADDTSWNCFMCMISLFAIVFVAVQVGVETALHEIVFHIFYNVIYFVNSALLFYIQFAKLQKSTWATKFGFVLDVLSNVHYLMYYLFTIGIVPLWVCRNAKIACYYLRLYRPVRYLWFLNDTHLIGGGVIGTTLKYVYIFCLLRVTYAILWIHLIWYEINFEQHLEFQSKLSQTPMFKRSHEEFMKNPFLWCLYLVDKMFIPIGPQVYPFNDLERVLTMVVMVTGNLTGIGFTIANLAIVTSVVFQHEESFRARLAVITNDMVEMRVPKQLREKVKTFYRMFWHKQKAISGSVLMPTFPPTTFNHIYSEIYFEAQQKSRILRDLPNQFLEELAKSMTTINYIPGDWIIKRKSTKASIIYIAYGDIEMMTGEDDVTPMLRFSRGTVINGCGGCPAVGCARSHVEIRAATFCTAHVLSASNLWKVAVKFGKSSEIFIIHSSFEEHFERVRRHYEARYHPTVKYKSSILYMKNNLMDLKHARDADGKLLLERIDVFLEIAGCYVMRNRNDSSLMDESDRICLRSTFPCILQPVSSLLVAWNAFVALLTFVVAVTHPYNLVHKREISRQFRFFDYLVSGIFILDIITHLSTGDKIEDGLPISFKQTSIHQMRTIWFGLDVLAVLPIFEFVGNSFFTGINKLCKLPKLFRTLKQMETEAECHTNVFRFLSYILVGLLSSYLIACLQQGFMCFTYVFPRWTIRPDGRYMQCYEWLRVLCAILCIFVFPNYIYFQFQFTWLRYLAILLDYSAYFDIFQRMLVGYYNEKGILVYHPASTAMHYFKGAFTADLFASLPLEILALSAARMHQSITRPKFYLVPPLAQYLMFNRLLQLYRLPNMLKTLSVYIEREDILLIIKGMPLLLGLLNVMTSFLFLESIDMYAPYGGNEWYFEEKPMNETWITTAKSIYSMCPVLLDCDLPLLGLIGRAVNSIYFLANTRFIEKNDVIEDMYFVNKGTVVVRDSNDDNLQIMKLPRGSIFGNLEQKKRVRCMNTFMADSNVHLLKINALVFYKIISEFPKNKTLMEQYRVNNENYIIGGQMDTRAMPIWKERTPSSTNLYETHEGTFKYCDMQRSNIMHIYLIIVSLLSIYTETYNITFQDNRLPLVVILYLLDFLFFLKMVINYAMANGVFDTKVKLNLLNATKRNASADGPRERPRPSESALGQHKGTLKLVSIDLEIGSPDSCPHGSLQRGKKVGVLPPSSPQPPSSERVVLSEPFRGLLVRKYAFTEGGHCIPTPLTVEHRAHDGRQREISAHYRGQGVPLGAPCRTFCHGMTHCIDGSATLVTDRGRLPTCNPVQVFAETSMSGENLHQYCKGVFKYDVISCVPFELFCFLAQNKWMAFSCLRLNRLFRAVTISECMRKHRTKPNINLVLSMLVSMIIWFMLYIHCMTCAWCFIGKLEDERAPNSSWLHLNTTTAPCQWPYLCAFYFTLTTFTIDGVGDILPKVQSEVIFTCFLQIVSVLLYMIYVGGFSYIIRYKSFRFFEFCAKYAELLAYMKSTRVSKNLMKMINKYSLHLWRESRGVQMPYFLETAPQHLQTKVMSAAYMTHLTQHPTFRTCEPAFNRQLVRHLRMYFYDDAMYVVKQNEITDSMYMIHRGTVEEVAEDLEEQTQLLNDGDNFGIPQGLERNTPFTFSYRVIGKAQILTLSLDDWKYLVKHFQKSKNVIFKDKDIDQDRKLDHVVKKATVKSTPDKSKTDDLQAKLSPDIDIARSLDDRQELTNVVPTVSSPPAEPEIIKAVVEAPLTFKDTIKEPVSAQKPSDTNSGLNVETTKFLEDHQETEVFPVGTIAIPSSESINTVTTTMPTTLGTTAKTMTKPITPERSVSETKPLISAETLKDLQSNSKLRVGRETANTFEEQAQIEETLTDITPFKYKVDAEVDIQKYTEEPPLNQLKSETDIEDGENIPLKKENLGQLPAKSTEKISSTSSSIRASKESLKSEKAMTLELPVGYFTNPKSSKTNLESFFIGENQDVSPVAKVARDLLPTENLQKSDDIEVHTRFEAGEDEDSKFTVRRKSTLTINRDEIDVELKMLESDNKEETENDIPKFFDPVTDKGSSQPGYSHNRRKTEFFTLDPHDFARVTGNEKNKEYQDSPLKTENLDQLHAKTAEISSVGIRPFKESVTSNVTPEKDESVELPIGNLSDPKIKTESIRNNNLFSLKPKPKPLSSPEKEAMDPVDDITHDLLNKVNREKSSDTETRLNTHFKSDLYEDTKFIARHKSTTFDVNGEEIEEELKMSENEKDTGSDITKSFDPVTDETSSQPGYSHNRRKSEFFDLTSKTEDEKGIIIYQDSSRENENVDQSHTITISEKFIKGQPSQSSIPKSFSAAKESSPETNTSHNRQKSTFYTTDSHYLDTGVKEDVDVYSDKPHKEATLNVLLSPTTQISLESYKYEHSTTELTTHPTQATTTKNPSAMPGPDYKTFDAGYKHSLFLSFRDKIDTFEVSNDDAEVRSDEGVTHVNEKDSVASMIAYADGVAMKKERAELSKSKKSEDSDKKKD
ncbi:uncharacterized protein LOC113232650 [Hyposmocoma kahamanoa]|uniref:uncharacterized protein LOC113232650 n=1 Tax=Hyposmocoma kahamanoa TaxID=1477025 RepID=UPI000E6D6FEA|nr:uncharacterized protein LOC113232650 [Hyposmocoma kahamanoa]